jgi:dipeptidase D
MSDPIHDLAPRSVWGHFAGLASIPRPSGKEEAAAAFVISVAEKAGATVVRDKRGNVVARVPATPGREKAPTVILQTHLDMVCEKNRDGVPRLRPRSDRHPHRRRMGSRDRHDARRRQRHRRRRGARYRHRSRAKHGPLELLFTLDEETGLTGAMQLDPSILTGKMLLNLDSEEDGVIFVGCAGGEDTLIDLAPRWTAPASGSTALHLEIAGLRGGHSGLNIIENRGNALKLVARVLAAAVEAGVPFELASVAGGSKHNAIPREAEAVIVIAAADRAKLEAIAASQLAGFKTELAKIDDGLKLAWSEAPMPARVMAAGERDRLLG